MDNNNKDEPVISNVVSMSTRGRVDPNALRGDIIKAAEYLLNSAKQGKLTCLYVTALTADGLRLEAHCASDPNHFNYFAELGMLEALKQEFIFRNKP